MRLAKEFRKEVERAKALGFRVRETKSGYRLLAPDGVSTVGLHCTNSDVRALRNFRADIRRALAA